MPETAPFTPEQRAWLNGFFAGLLSTARRHRAVAEQDAGADARRRQRVGDADDGDAPWHDQTMPLADRMKLAEGRPLRRRMMAAMAQQDCGQCGYNCEDYSDAHRSRKKEERLNLCVPGGKETARMLKALHDEIGTAPAPVTAKAADAPAAATGAGRGEPAARATIRRRDASSRARGSTRRARRRRPGTSNSISPAAALDYTVGDAFGLFPTNDPALVDAVIEGARRAGRISRSAGARCARC